MQTLQFDDSMIFKERSSLSIELAAVTFSEVDWLIGMGSITINGRPDRRKKQRIQLSQPVVGRVGTIGAVLVDLSESGARVEHYTRLKTGSHTSFRFAWESEEIATECVVVSSRVHRFSPGDAG